VYLRLHFSNYFRRMWIGKPWRSQVLQGNGRWFLGGPAMASERFVSSLSGVRIFTGFRENMIVYRYGPIFARMPTRFLQSKED
jgi:hypothetical protein